MTVGELKELLYDMDDDMEILIDKSSIVHRDKIFNSLDVIEMYEIDLLGEIQVFAVMSSDVESGIEILNSFSNSIINSTVSSESAPKSLVKLASVTTSLSSTLNLSTIMAFTFSAISDMILFFDLSCKETFFS